MVSTGVPKASVIGAGLVGSLFSVFLAKRGFEVTLYERRPDMRKSAMSAGRSINLAVSVRGIAALKEAGLAEGILEQAIPMKGRMIHALGGQLTFQRYGRDDSECIYSISRGQLNQALLTAAEATGRVKIEFQKNLQKFDSQRGTLQFLNEASGAQENVVTDRVFGTDGSASALRQTVLEQKGVSCSQTPLNYGYKELSIPPQAGPFEKRFALDPNSLHIWPRGNFMLIALPNFDGTFTCTLFLPFDGPVSFATLKDTQSVQAFFQEYFADALPLISDLGGSFFQNPTGQMVTVKTSQWNLGGQALLLGDAAHAIVPFFGQGMNCGFEDLSVFDRMLGIELKTATLDQVRWSRLFSEFSQQRRPDANSIADLAVEHFTEMRDKVADPHFLASKKLEAVLQKEFPDGYISRYSMVSFSRIPYRWAVQAGLIQSRILTRLSEGATKPEEVNLEKAKTLIETELTPLMLKAQEDLRKWT